jgi:hypothetical protein
MLDVAKEYLDKGYSIIPLSGKRPAIDSWVEYQSKKPSKEQITKWFSEPKNIGIICGAISGIVVIDIDPRNGGSVSEYLRKYPTDHFVHTGSGGAHLYYKHPGGKVPNIHPAPGIDIKGDGGYVVAPPSLHPDTNQPYLWVGKGNLAAFPLELLNRDNKEEEKKSDPWISSLLLSGAKDGEKNNSLTELAGYLAGKEIPEDIAKGFLSLWNMKNQSRIEATEFNQTIESVYRTEKRNAPGKKQHVELTQHDETYLGPKEFSVQPHEHFMRSYAMNTVDWIIPGWMPDKTILFAISEPGTFKTWTLFDAAVSIAMKGAKFLGKVPVAKHGPVLLIQQEDAHGGTAERLEVIRRSKLAKLDHKFSDDEMQIYLPEPLPLYIHTDRQLDFSNLKVLKALEKQIQTLGIKVVIIDPLYSAVSTDDYMTKAAEQMFFLKELRDKYDCSFIIAHHTNKAGGDARARAWGSQFLNAFLESGWQMFKKGEASVKIKRHFKASSNPEETCLSFYIDTAKEFYYEVVEGLVDAKNDDEVLEDDLIKPDPDELEDFKPKMTIEQMNEIDEITSSEDAKKRGRGKGVIKKDLILSYIASRPGEWIAAAEIAAYLKSETTPVQKKLDQMVEANLLKLKEEPRKRPGWKKSYRIKF